MLLIDSNGNYPKWLPDLIEQNPDWQEGDDLPAGWESVNWGDYPTEIPDGKTVEEVYPEKVNGNYVQKFIVRDMTTEELEIQNAPETAKAKLLALGLTEIEIKALARGLR